MTSLVCQVLYLLIMCIAYGKYANDGLEDRGLKTFGKWKSLCNNYSKIPDPIKGAPTTVMYPLVWRTRELLDFTFTNDHNFYNNGPIFNPKPLLESSAITCLFQWPHALAPGALIWVLC